MKMVHITCNPGQSVFAAIDEAKSEGKLPSTASWSNHRPGNDNWATESKLIDGKPTIGTVKVRQNEQFYIIDNA